MPKIARISLIVLTALALAACIDDAALQLFPTVIVDDPDHILPDAYIVRRGDDLGRIAAKFDTTSQAIIDANRIENRSILYRGQRLHIPRNSPADMDLPTESAPVLNLVQIDAPGAEMDANLVDEKVHVVHRGDSLRSIARRYGIAVNKLVAANKLQGPILFRGQKLFIPLDEQGTAPHDAEDNLALSAPRTELITVTKTVTKEIPVMMTEFVTVSEVVTVEMPVVITEFVPVTKVLTVETPLVTFDVITVTETVTETVFVTISEEAPPVLVALEAWSEPDDGIEVLSPAKDGAYHSPLEIIGLSDTHGGIINLRLLDDEGQILARRVGIGGVPKGFDFFHTSLRFTVEEPTAAMLQISETDAANATRMHHSETEVILLPGQRAIDLRRPAVGAAVCGPVLVLGYSDSAQGRILLELRTAGGESIEQANTIGGHHGHYRDFFVQMDPVNEKPVPLVLSASASGTGGQYNGLDETVVPFTLYPAGTKGCP